MSLNREGFVRIVSTLLFLPGAQAAEPDLRAFVHVQYHHGPPYEEAVKFNQSAVPTLLEMLRDPGEQSYYPNIVFALGVIGDDRAAEALINFLEKDTRGDVNSVLIRALTAVPMALGHIASKGNTRALNYLIARADPDIWHSKTLPWSFQGRSGEQMFGNGLIDGSITALGISAHPQAVRALKNLQNKPEIHEDLKAKVAEALKLAQRINSEGRTRVFRGQSRP